ncbi:ABC transporter substrate-binding protein [Actinacidiphila sp. bgisy144]|uniref:ABC transporter substrate-binding protein n=1 Tax=Actinacidiphila sp. bgisy144 TaxID=3413791 RepID=UPI003EBC7DB5
MAFRRTARRRVLAAASVGLAIGLTLTGCSSSSGSGSGGGSATQADIDAALHKKTTISFWSWAPQAGELAKAFEKQYPDITVKVSNVGGSDVEYTKLQNAVKAGSGVPDVAYMEYLAMPQFALQKSLTDLSKYGQSGLSSQFPASTWSQVALDGGVYGVPMDSGPLVLYYRADVFKKYGLKVPATWAEYTADAQKLHQADASKYITADAGDGNGTAAMIWQAGGKPFSSAGSKLSVDLADAGSTAYAGMWGGLLSKGLIDSKTAQWSNEWLTGMADGTYATWVAGAWGGSALETHVPKASGDWRVAPIPQYTAGRSDSSQSGGSGLVVPSGSKNKLAAAGFVRWMTTSAAANKIWVQAGQVPALNSTLTSAGWLGDKSTYFGGQQVNQVYAQASAHAPAGWQYLPFEPYANSVYSDTVGQAFAGRTSLKNGLAAWQKKIVSYAKAQGFSVD